MSASNPAPWGSSFRLVAAEKWKAKSAVLGSAVTEALIEYSHPSPDMRVLDLASGTGEPGISLARRVPRGFVTAVDQSSELLDIAAEVRGDLLLQLIGNRCRLELPLLRLESGDEFVAVVPMATDARQEFGDRLIASMQAHPAAGQSVSISIGTCWWDSGELEEAVQIAARAASD